MTAPRLLHAQIAPFLQVGARSSRVYLLVEAGVSPDGIWIRSEPDNEERLTPLHPAELASLSAAWQPYLAELGHDPCGDQTRYAFKLLIGERQWWLDAAGVSSRMPLAERSFRIAAETPPDWVPDQVFYQIFPERFRDGDTASNVRDGEYELRDSGPVRAKAWGESIDGSSPNRDFYGGDLPGVYEALPYLQDLGVTALYLNPIFTSPSVHKYDTEDHLQVDPHLGGDQALIELRQATRERGMRLLLDAVFNHTSDTHPRFNRWGTHPEPGAYQDRRTAWGSLYQFADRGNPESYICWMGSKPLPVIDFGQVGARDYFWRADDSVARHWLREPFAVDGWRLDVAAMMGEGRGARNNLALLRELRAAIKDENPSAWFIGEHFAEASAWLQGDIEDGAMNYYGFAQPVRAFLAGRDVNYHPVCIDAAELDVWLSDARSRIPYANQLGQLNLLGSHDTTRFLTLLDGDRALMRIALTLLFTYPGVPCIYYGDEIGMEGENDPYNRACFDWDETRWDAGLRGCVKALAELRRSRSCLRRGGCLTLHAEGDCLVFARFDADGQVLVALNRSGVHEWEIGLDLSGLPFHVEALSSLLGSACVSVRRGRLDLSLPAKSFAVLESS